VGSASGVRDSLFLLLWQGLLYCGLYSGIHLGFSRGGETNESENYRANENSPMSVDFLTLFSPTVY